MGNNSISPGTLSMVCYNYSGNIKWSVFNISGMQTVMDAALDNSGNIAISGFSGSNGHQHDYVTFMYNSSGGLAWFNIYDGAGSGEDVPNSIAIDANNNIYITGYSQNAGTGSDITTIKFNQAGMMLWEKRYNFTGVGNDYGASVAADNNGNVYVTGHSIVSNLNFDFTTIKYSQGAVFGKLTGNAPHEFKLYSNFPNPFNPSTYIKFDISKESDVRIEVYDMLGKAVSTLIDERMKTGSYEVSFNASTFSSGTYFYKMSAGDFTDIKKMILVK